MFLKVPVIIIIKFRENNVLGTKWIYKYISSLEVLYCPLISGFLLITGKLQEQVTL